MELIIQGTDGIPSESILSIRSGTTRRQAQLASVDRPFKFPCKPEDCAAVKIDIFQHVGTARTVSQAGTKEHRLVLEPVANASKQTITNNMEISFQTRAAEKNAPCISDGTIDQGRKQRTEVAMDKYLEKHNLTAFLQSVLQGLVKEQPDNPYAFIARQFVAEAFEVRARKEIPLPERVTMGQVGTYQYQRLEDAMEDVKALRQTVNELEKQLSNLVLENNELKTINAGFGAAGDHLRNEARSMFVGGLRSGALGEALAQVNATSEMDILKSKAKDTLAMAAKDGQLRDTLQWISKTEESAPVMDLRSKARDDFLAAAKDGRLNDILRTVKPAPSIRAQSLTPVLIDRSFASYYKQHVQPNISMATIHARFQLVKNNQAVDGQRADEDSINVLNSELEQLAKDRAKLLEQVNQIRNLMVDVAADNNRLAQEVLNRPMSSDGADMVLTQSLSNLM